MGEIRSACAERCYESTARCLQEQAQRAAAARAAKRAAKPLSVAVGFERSLPPPFFVEKPIRRLDEPDLHGDLDEDEER